MSRPTIRDMRAGGPYTYAQMEAMLGRRTSLNLPGRATFLIRRDDNSIVVRYRGTCVVEWRPCGRVILRDGGWRSVTTKDRINVYSHAQVCQRNGRWYVTMRDHLEREWTGEISYKVAGYGALRWLE